MSYLIRDNTVVDIMIDKEILKRARKCENNLACLRKHNHMLCRVVRIVSNDLSFLNCAEGITCVYRETNDYSTNICSCPVRQKINRQYMI